MAQRVSQLDFLRGIAILLVLGNHLRFVPPLSGLDAIIFGGFVYAGWSGVDLFFVLSGFLVSGLIFAEFKRTGEFRAGRFLIRRGFKIYPSFYVFLFSTMPLIYYLQVDTRSPRWLAEVLFLQNYLPTVWTHTWSLAVEEHFYISLAIMLWIIIRQTKSMKSVPYACLGIMIAALSFRLIQVSTGHWPFGQTHMRADALAFGVLLSYLHHFVQPKLSTFANKKTTLLMSACLILIGVLLHPKFSSFGFTWGLSCLYLGFGCLMMHLLYSPWTDNKFSRIISTIGVYSYSIYLWHKAVNYSVKILFEHIPFPAPLCVTALVYFLIALTFGILIAKIIEFPVLHFRDKAFPTS